MPRVYKQFKSSENKAITPNKENKKQESKPVQPDKEPGKKDSGEH